MNCSQSRCPYTSNTKQKCTNQSSYNDKLDRMVTIVESITIKSAKFINVFSSITKAIILLDSAINVYNDMDLYMFSKIFLCDENNHETFLNMQP